MTEISDLVQRYWDIENHADLARFIKLKSSGGKYLLYVREFQPGVLLALVEDIRTPISIAGAQASNLKQMLIEQVNASLPEFLEIPMQPEDESIPLDSDIFSPAQSSEQSASDQIDEFEDTLEDGEILSPEERLQQQKVLEMLADLPTPDPKPYPEITIADGVDNLSKEIPETSGKESNGARIDWEIDEFIANQADGLFTDETTQEKFPDPDAPLNDILDQEKQVSEKPKEAFPGAIPVSYPGKEASNSHHPEPATPAMADLTYTCVLIPRLPFHRLNGDLELQLSRWLPDLCLAFGWRLGTAANRTGIHTMEYPGGSGCISSQCAAHH